MVKDHTAQYDWELDWLPLPVEVPPPPAASRKDTGLFDTRGASHMVAGRERTTAFDNDSFIFEAILNGGRCFAYLAPGEESIVGFRGEQLLPRFPELAGISGQVAGPCILDGEIVVFKHGIPDRKELGNRVLVPELAQAYRASRRLPAMFVAHDIVYGPDGQVTDLPLLDRKEILQNTVTENGAIAVGRFLRGQGRTLYNTVRQRGLEGVTAKHKNSLYYLGSKSPNWILIKDFIEDEYVICGYTKTSGEIPALVLGRRNGSGGMLYGGRVTLGVSAGDVAAVARQAPVSGHPFLLAPPDDVSDIAWITPVLACSVSFTARDEHGKVYNPFYRGLHLDRVWETENDRESPVS